MFLPTFVRRSKCKVPATPAAVRRIKLAMWIIAGLLQVVGAIGLIHAETWHAASVTTSGVVVGHQSHKVKGRTKSAETVTFLTATGESITFTDSTSSSDPFPKGAHVPVRYSPTNASSAMIDEWHRLWLFPGILFAMGSTLVVVGMFMRIPKDASAATSEPSTVSAS